MKIAFLLEYPGLYYQFHTLIKGLRAAGCEVKYITVEKSTLGNSSHCLWHRHDFSTIDRFKPDRIVMWNGHRRNANPSVMELRAKYKIFKVEQGWFPQRGRGYMDTEMGYGGELSKFDLSKDVRLTRSEEHLINKTREQYLVRPDLYKMKHPYILVPLQLETDISILKDSPHFTRMDVFLDYLSEHTSDYPILVKHHPKVYKWRKKELDEKYKGHPRIRFIKDENIRTIDLVQNAKAIVGLNSTVLTEAHLFDTPVIPFANSAFLKARTDLLDKKDFTDDLVDNKAIKRNTLLLLAVMNQWRRDQRIPNWVVQKVINYDIRPRFPYSSVIP